MMIQSLILISILAVAVESFRPSTVKFASSVNVNKIKMTADENTDFDAPLERRMAVGDIVPSGEGKPLASEPAYNQDVDTDAPVDRRMAVGNIKKSTSSLSPAMQQLGALPPFGFFDPLGLSDGKTAAEMKKYRESELKHGRVAMVAALGIFTGETINPLFDHKITGPAIYQFQQADELVSFFWVGVVFLIGLIEGQNIIVGWDSPGKTSSSTSGMAMLKEDYVNGDLGFDPLGIKPKDTYEYELMQVKELSNGRLAMLAVAGMVAQELVTNEGIAQEFIIWSLTNVFKLDF